MRAPTAARPRAAARQRLWIHGLPMAVRLALLVLAWVLFRRLQSLPLALLVVLPLLALAEGWLRWRHARLAARPSLEPALNGPALEWLRAGADFARVRLEDESPRESVYLPGWRSRWLLVTNRRVLLFVAASSERRLVSEWSRRAVVFAGPATGLPRLARGAWSLLRRPPNLVLAFTTGTVLQLHCASTATAARVGQLLMSSPALPGEDSVMPALHLPEARRTR
jgi:hypothetical protein